VAQDVPMHAASLMIRRIAASMVAVAVTSLLAPRAAFGQPTPPAPGLSTLPSPAPIDVPQPARAFSLSEALAYAHEHQPAIRAALARVSEKMAEASIPSGQWLPTVGVTGQLFAATANNTTGTYVNPPFMDIPRIGATPTTATGSLQPYASTIAAAGITQEVFDFGRIGAQRAAADALVEVEKHHADADRLDVDFGVEEAFFSVVAAKSIVKASDDAYERARVHRDLAKAGVASGLRPPIELTRAEADLTRFDLGRIRAAGGVATAQSVFAAAIGANDPAIDVSGDAADLGDLPTLARALQLAQARDPRLARAVAELKAAEENTRAVGAELRPELYGTATVSGRAGGAASSGTTPVVADGNGWIPNVPNWDVGLVFSWPIYDGVVTARRDAAHAAEQVRRAEVDVAREQEAAEVRQTHVEVQVARSGLVALDNAVVAARANYDQADARFRAGLGTAVELADAEALRTDAEIARALGQFELARARAALGRAIAEGL
jgi:outer membrane protein